MTHRFVSYAHGRGHARAERLGPGRRIAGAVFELPAAHSAIQVALLDQDATLDPEVILWAEPQRRAALGLVNADKAALRRRGRMRV
jgi:hypothetical protein